MAADSIRNGLSKPQKPGTKHPYAAIEHRVIDSPAYADLTFSARALLVLLTRQLSKDNNGHLQATYTYLQRFGFDSERTICRGIKELVAHGIIYRTRCGGYQQGASQYAVTWLPITNRQGLFLEGFKRDAWRPDKNDFCIWRPKEKKTPPAKRQDTHGKNGILTPVAHAKNTGSTPRKNADNELMPCSSDVSTQMDGANKVDSALLDDPEPADFQRIRDDDHSADKWDSELGSFISTRQARAKQTILYAVAA